MNIASFIVVFAIFWCFILFMILPVGIVREDIVQQGNDPGAPKDAKITKKIIISAIISILGSLLYFYLLKKGFLDFINIRQ